MDLFHLDLVCILFAVSLAHICNPLTDASYEQGCDVGARTN